MLAEAKVSKKAVVYARVSVREEDINNQIRNIEEWAKLHGYEIVAVFKDEAITGASDPLKRPKFQMMLEFMKDNNLRTILVYDISRFGRSLISAANALQALVGQHYAVIFTKFDLVVSDFHDMATKSVIYSLLMAAEFERDILHQRMEAAKAAGKIIHRPPTPIPMKEVKALLEQGWTFRQIHAYLLGQGKLKYRTKHGERQLSYQRFRQRLNEMGIYRKSPETRAKIKEGVKRRKK